MIRLKQLLFEDDKSKKTEIPESEYELLYVIHLVTEMIMVMTPKIVEDFLMAI